MDLSFKSSCLVFVLLVHVFFAVVARNDPSSRSREVGFFKDQLINATNTIVLVASDECSSDKIYISQGETTPLPSGIPTYTVEVQNICVPTETGTQTRGCSISDIHLRCGWFSSARLINPAVFRRIVYDDCLVNDGNPINPGQMIVFQYANTYSYPLSVSSVSCN